ncbi:hypothetical protein N9O88_00425 [bacterium]|nr:hypothetical protein [bacterium]
MVKYLFPEDIFKHIFTFLPQPYKKPLHLIAINNNELFADFTCDSLMEDESVEHLVPLVGWAGARDSLAFGYNHGWQNSFMNYKKWREFINSY